MISCVYFDLDETLYDYESINVKAVSMLMNIATERYGITYDEAREAFDYGRRTTKEKTGNCAAGHNRLLYCQRMLEYLGKNPVEDAEFLYHVYWDFMLKNMNLKNGVADLLYYLNGTNVKVGICTDLTAFIQHRKIKALGITNYLDYLVTSEEAGAEKPDKRIFDLCIEKANCPAEQIVFIGDSFEKDYLGAKNAGMKGLQANGTEWCAKIRRMVENENN